MASMMEVHCAVLSCFSVGFACFAPPGTTVTVALARCVVADGA